MSGPRVTDKDKGYANIMQRLGAFREVRMLVGIRQEQGSQRVATLDEGGNRIAVEGGAGDPTLAEIAFFNEFGIGPPERSFLRSTMDERQREYVEFLANGLDAYIMGKGVPPAQLMDQLGLLAVGQVQEKITSLRDPPNAQATIDAKGSSNPLIDTGRLRQSIDHKVQK